MCHICYLQADVSDTSRISKGISPLCGQLNEILFPTDYGGVLDTQHTYSLFYCRHSEPEADAASNFTDPLRGTRNEAILLHVTL